MKLLLVDLNPDLCAAWERAFKDDPDVRGLCGPFEELQEYDCMVSAANSFGLMDGGVDLAIRRYFGDALQATVQEMIGMKWHGYQPVGTSMIVPTNNDDHPWLAHTPTMRVPKPIAGTDNVYNAMWAMLCAVDSHNMLLKPEIDIIACPGLGTATGRVSPPEAARQMALAWKHFKATPFNADWHAAVHRDSEIAA